MTAKTIPVVCDHCAVESTIWTPRDHDGEKFRWNCSPCGKDNWAFDDGIPNIVDMGDEEIYQLIAGDGASGSEASS